MAYVTTTQLAARLGTTLYARLTDRVNGSAADDAVGQQIIAEAEAEAESHLARRYATPVNLTAHPELAATFAARVLDIAEFTAWKGSPFVSDVPSRVRAVYEVAQRWMADVAEGRIVLPAARPPASSVASEPDVQFVSTPRTFTHEELEGV